MPKSTRRRNPLIASLSAAAVTATALLVPALMTTAASATTTATYLSDLTLLTATNGWGPVEKDQSNGSQGAGDGSRLTVGGQVFAKGLGVHASSDVTVKVPAGATTFAATVGIDDSQGSAGSVVFQVFNGSTKVFDSGRMTGASANKQVSVPVTPGSTLRLVVTDAGDWKNNDHADWADARFLAPAAPAAPTAPAPAAPAAPTAPAASTTYLSDLTPVSATNGWGPMEKDQSNGGQGAGDGSRLTVGGQVFAKGLGVHASSDVRFTVPAGATTFAATIGVDDSQGSAGSVVFQVFDGSAKLFDSGRMTGTSANQQVSVPVTPSGTLRLVVTDAGDWMNNDHADWAHARFLTTPSPTPSPTPTSSPTSSPTPSPTPAPVAPAPVSASAVFPKADWFWKPVPTASPRLDPNSSAISAKLAQPGLNRVALLYRYGSPIVEADASTPRYKLIIKNAGTTAGKWGYNDLGTGTVPIPAHAMPSTGTDGKITIIDWSTRKVYDLWQASRVGDTWAVSWGGVYPLDGDGSARNAAYQGQYSVPWPQPVSRATGSGIATFLGTVRLSEIEAGHIPHALGITTDMACGPANTGPFRWPATTTDGTINSGTCVEEGSRLQLDPSIDLSKIPGISKAELAVGRAMQTYGGIVNDIGGSRMSFYFEKPSPGQHDPYPGLGMGDYYAFTKLPWDKLRVLASWNGA